MVKLKPASAAVLDELEGTNTPNSPINGHDGIATNGLEISPPSESTIEAPNETDAQATDAEATTETVTLTLRTALRRITVPVPAECETKITLFFLHHNAAAQPSEPAIWCPGFRIERSYDTEPHDAIHEELPMLDMAEEDTYTSLGDAVIAAAGWAGWWLVTNTGDISDDPQGIKADSALDDWKRELQPETITESCFDEATPEEINQATDGPAVATALTVIESDGSGGMATAKTGLAAMLEGVPTEVESPAEDYEEQKSKLAWRIATAHMELAKAKASVKRLNKSIESAVAELEELEEEGPEELPLFDRTAPQSEATAETRDERAKELYAEAGTAIDLSQNEGCQAANASIASEAAAENATENTAETENTTEAEGAEWWRESKLEDLPGITPKLSEICAAERIYTIGQWVDFPNPPPRGRGLEYRVIKGMTEVRMAKIGNAVTEAIAGK